MKIQIRRAQDGKRYIVSIDVSDGVCLERTIDEDDYRLLKEQIEILDKVELHRRILDDDKKRGEGGEDT
ncbi:hypothetical protein ES706_03752 [subsurface metagenome]